MVRSMVPWRTRFPRPLVRFEEEMENFFNRLIPEEGWLKPLEGFSPDVNLVETDLGFELTVDLPGLKPEDVTVEMRDGGLWISGKREEEKEEKGKTYHRLERRYGEFQRLIPLPVPVDQEKVEAEYHDGVLKISVPKTEESKPKRIEVKS